MGIVNGQAYFNANSTGLTFVNRASGAEVSPPASAQILFPTVYTVWPFTTDANGLSALKIYLSNVDAYAGETDPKIHWGISLALSLPPTDQKKTISLTAGTYGNVQSGTETVKLLPNTQYYFWLWEEDSYANVTNGACALVASGTCASNAEAISMVTLNEFTFGWPNPVSFASNGIPGATFTIQAKVKRENGSYKTVTLQTKKTTTDPTLTLATATFGSVLPNTKETTCQLIITAYHGSTVAGTLTSKAVKATFRGKATVASGAFTCSIDNSNAGSQTGLIWRLSKFAVTINRSKITPESGASIAKITLNGEEIGSSATSWTSPTVTNGFGVYAVITDSRGNTTTAYYHVTSSGVGWIFPNITSMSVLRVGTSTGTAEDMEGTYMRITYETRCSFDQTIKMYVRLAGTSSWGSATTLTPDEETFTQETGRSTTWVYAADVGGGRYSGTYCDAPICTASGTKVFSGYQDKTYEIKLTVTDGAGQSVSLIQKLSCNKWLIHGKVGMTGAAIGKTAENDNELQIPADWDFTSGEDFALLTRAQTLTAAQKTQVLANIGALKTYTVRNGTAQSGKNQLITSGGVYTTVENAKTALRAEMVGIATDTFNRPNDMIGAMTELTFDVTKSGYTPVGVIAVELHKGSYYDQYPAVTDSVLDVVFVRNAYISGNNAIVRLGSTSTTPYASTTITVLYIKT